MNFAKFILLLVLNKGNGVGLTTLVFYMPLVMLNIPWLLVTKSVSISQTFKLNKSVTVVK